MHLIDTKISQNVQIDSQGRFTITKDFYFEKMTQTNQCSNCRPRRDSRREGPL